MEMILDSTWGLKKIDVALRICESENFVVDLNP